MAAVVYVLCMAASALCAVLLWRAYARSLVRLLFWSALCFFGLFINNLLLFVDRIILGPDVSLAIWRSLAGVFAMAAMVYGFIWDSE